LAIRHVDLYITHLASLTLREGLQERLSSHSIPLKVRGTKGVMKE